MEVLKEESYAKKQRELTVEKDGKGRYLHKLEGKKEETNREKGQICRR